MANQGQPIIPITSCKLPPPRQLDATDETRESLTTWLGSARSFFSRDDNYRFFTLPGTTWSKNEDHYGFQAEADTTRLRRTAEEMEAAFLRFCSDLAAFFPHGYFTRKFPLTTSWNNICETVYKTYNKQLNASSFLSYTEVKKAPDENPYIFFERLYDHFFQHLAGPTIAVEEYTTGEDGDSITLSHANLIAMVWLEKLDRRLPRLVQKEYAPELRREGTHLISLVPRIAGDMDSLLDKLETSSQINRFQQQGGGFQRGSGRQQRGFQQSSFQSNNGRNRSSNRGGRQGGGDPRDRQSHCSHCQHLSKELGIPVPFDHSPLQCRRRRVQVRLVQDQEEQETAEDEDL